jgi:hypothetical protein
MFESMHPNMTEMEIAYVTHFYQSVVDAELQKSLKFVDASEEYRVPKMTTSQLYAMHSLIFRTGSLGRDINEYQRVMFEALAKLYYPLEYAKLKVAKEEIGVNVDIIRLFNHPYVSKEWVLELYGTVQFKEGEDVDKSNSIVKLLRDPNSRNALIEYVVGAFKSDSLLEKVDFFQRVASIMKEAHHKYSDLRNLAFTLMSRLPKCKSNDKLCELLLVDFDPTKYFTPKFEDLTQLVGVDYWPTVASLLPSASGKEFVSLVVEDYWSKRRHLRGDQVFALSGRMKSALLARYVDRFEKAIDNIDSFGTIVFGSSSLILHDQLRDKYLTLLMTISSDKWFKLIGGLQGLIGKRRLVNRKFDDVEEKIDFCKSRAFWSLWKEQKLNENTKWKLWPSFGQQSLPEYHTSPTDSTLRLAKLYECKCQDYNFVSFTFKGTRMDLRLPFGASWDHLESLILHLVWFGDAPAKFVKKFAGQAVASICGANVDLSLI